MPGKILIVDDILTNRLLLRAMLERDFYTVIDAENGEIALRRAHNENPDMILLDVNMPVMDGCETCRRLKSNATTNLIPVIMVTASNAKEERRAGLSAGADDFLTKPVEESVLFARVRNLMNVKLLTDELILNLSKSGGNDVIKFTPSQLSPIKTARILHVLDLPALEEVHKTHEIDPTTDFFTTSEQGTWEILRTDTHKFDALVVSEVLPGEGIGHRLIAHMRAEVDFRKLVIIFIARSTESGLRALDLGANDYIMEPLDPIELNIRLKTQLRRKYYTDQMREVASKQMRLSDIDPLTELHNRRYLDDFLPNLRNHEISAGLGIAFMMMDIDHFKTINDTYGHAFGDKVLTETAKRLKENLRESDLIVRFGGEEFVVITTDVSPDLAQSIAERLRLSIEEAPFVTDDRKSIKVTISIGAILTSGTLDDPITEINHADKALYTSKEQGRNRVTFANK